MKNIIMIIAVVSLFVGCSKEEPFVGIRVEKVYFDFDEFTYAIGQKGYQRLNIYPENATNKTVSWSSSNSKVAKVDSNGLITAVGKGNCIITAFVDGKKDTCKIIVGIQKP